MANIIQLMFKKTATAPSKGEIDFFLQIEWTQRVALYKIYIEGLNKNHYFVLPKYSHLLFKHKTN